MKGFTLTETLVAILIMTIIFGGVLMTMTVGQRSFFTGNVETDLREQITRAVMAMDSEISQTKPTRTDLDIGETGNSITFSVPNDIDGDGTVVDSMGSIEWSAVNITYSLNASNQIIRTSAGASRVIANNIISLQFQRTQDKLIQVDITAQDTSNLGRLIQDTEQAVIKMRN
jgi:prepilin-type N-terminal cleavage/methylation domain-containing protein